MSEYFNKLLESITATLPNLLTAILIFIISLYIARLLSNMLKRVLQRRKADPEITLLLSQLTRWSIIVVGLIAALQRFFDVSAFLAGLGILGFTIGFALQEIMQNFVAGVILLLQQPFDVDDFIETDQYTGTVLVINLRTTEMKTTDGRIVIIPNSTVLSNPITNYTRADFRRIELSVGVSYDVDPALVRQVVMDVVQKVPGYVPEPAPLVGFHTFGGSSIDMSAYFWIDTSKTNSLVAKDAAFELIKVAFENQGIDIPFPTTTVHMQSGK